MLVKSLSLKLLGRSPRRECSPVPEYLEFGAVTDRYSERKESAEELSKRMNQQSI